MSKHMEFYIQDDATSIQIGKNVYRRVSIPIDDFNAACDHYGFVKERTCKQVLTDCNDGLMPPFTAHCSACGDEWGFTPNYCPNCGARLAWVDDADAIRDREDDRIAAMRQRYFVGSGGRNIWGRA